MRLPLACALAAACLTAGAAQAQAWEVKPADGGCEARFSLTARRSPPGAATLRYDGERMRLAFPKAAGGTFRRLQVDRKSFAPALQPVGGGFEVEVDRAMEAAIARGRKLRIVWTKAPAFEAALRGTAGPGLEALKDCAEPFRLSRLPQLQAEEADVVGTYEKDSDIPRQAAIAEARRRFQQERLAAMAAGLYQPEEKTYRFEGLEPVVCTPSFSDFVCR